MGWYRSLRQVEQLLLNLLWFFCSLGCFVIIAKILAVDLPKPDWMPFDIVHGPWLSPMLKTFGLLTVGSSFFAVLVSIFNFGVDNRRWSLWRSQGHKDVYALRFPWGLRWGAAVLCIGLSAAIIFVLIWQEEPLAIWLFVAPMVLGFAYGAALVLWVNVDFDREHLFAVNYLLRRKHYSWADLEDLAYNPTWNEWHLYFRTGQMARVSVHYNGIVDFLAFCDSRLIINNRAEHEFG